MAVVPPGLPRPRVQPGRPPSVGRQLREDGLHGNRPGRRCPGHERNVCGRDHVTRTGYREPSRQDTMSGRITPRAEHNHGPDTRL